MGAAVPVAAAPVALAPAAAAPVAAAPMTLVAQCAVIKETLGLPEETAGHIIRAANEAMGIQPAGSLPAQVALLRAAIGC